MRVVKLLLLSVFSFALLIFLISLLLPSRAVIERSGVIDAPMDKVYAQLNNLQGWPQWNPWSAPAVTGPLQFSAPASGTGAWYSWQHGKVTVLDSDPRKGVHYRMDINNQKPVMAGLEIKPAADARGTAIRWYLQTDLGWLPWWKFRGFMADRLMGPRLEEGLTALKNRCEAK